HYNYEVELIKLSKFIDNLELENYTVNKDREKSEIYNQYYNKINKGNEIRNKYNNSFLAEKAIEAIHLERLKILNNKGITKPKPEDFETKRKLFIIDSIKSKEELELFRKVYTENFYQI